MSDRVLKIDVQSEVGQLEAVLMHTPGAEVENMTPKNAQRALYSDILNLSVARREYEQLSGVLGKVAKIYQVKELLIKVLDNGTERERLIGKICISENVTGYFEYLMDMPSVKLADALIEGVPARIDTLTAYLKDEYYALLPLYNYYFTRDASVSIGNNLLVCKMANRVRTRESLINDAIFRNSNFFECNIVNATDFKPGNNKDIYMEGGDILVAREDILLIGSGARSSSQGIDMLIDRLCRNGYNERQHVIVQQLPESPESFIHLDMVFTFLDRDKAMVFEPLILNDNQYQTVHITIDNGKVSKIRSVNNIPSVLKRLGMEVEPILCGGEDEWNQEREQWHSGANFFAVAPGKVISYARNIHTLEELSKNGFEIIAAQDIIEDKRSMNDYKLCAVTIDGSELPRGGGGARCMTMPLKRREK